MIIRTLSLQITHVRVKTKSYDLEMDKVSSLNVNLFDNI